MHDDAGVAGNLKLGVLPPAWVRSEKEEGRFYSSETANQGTKNEIYVSDGCCPRADRDGFGDLTKQYIQSDWSLNQTRLVRLPLSYINERINGSTEDCNRCSAAFF
jgi:hypothetical protein